VVEYIILFYIILCWYVEINNIHETQCLRIIKTLCTIRKILKRSSIILRCKFFRYQELADPSLKQKCPVWSCTLGETVYDIQTVEITPSATTIHVLGERNYYCFQGNGVLWFMKRLQYTPCCFHPYILGIPKHKGIQLLWTIIILFVHV